MVLMVSQTSECQPTSVKLYINGIWNDKMNPNFHALCWDAQFLWIQVLYVCYLVYFIKVVFCCFLPRWRRGQQMVFVIWFCYVCSTLIFSLVDTLAICGHNVRTYVIIGQSEYLRLTFSVRCSQPRNRIWWRGCNRLTPSWVSPLVLVFNFNVAAVRSVYDFYHVLLYNV